MAEPEAPAEPEREAEAELLPEVERAEVEGAAWEVEPTPVAAPLEPPERVVGTAVTA